MFSTVPCELSLVFKCIQVARCVVSICGGLILFLYVFTFCSKPMKNIFHTDL